MALTYTASDLPAGISFDATTRTLSGTPTTPGEGTIVITATDENDQTATYEVPYSIVAE